MNRIIKTDFFKNENCFNDDFKIEVELLGNEVENIENLIDDITNKFEEELKDYKIPSTFIPKNCEIIYDEDNFVGVFYSPEYVDYPTTKLSEYEEENYLTDDDEIGKNLFEADVTDGKLILEFISLLALTEDNTIKSIWEVNNGEIKKVFIEFITNLIEDEE